MSNLGDFLKDTITSMNAVRLAEETGDMNHLRKIGALKRSISTETTIEPRVGVSMTEYRITGELVHVLNAVEALFGQYDARGYDTRVHAIELSAQGPHYVARMSRSNSCE
jgi:hypothetical protein